MQDPLRRNAEKGGTRVIRPLQLDYWGRVWTVTAWDETARDFRVLRIDRIEALPGAPRLRPAVLVQDALGRTIA